MTPTAWAVIGVFAAAILLLGYGRIRDGWQAARIADALQCTDCTWHRSEPWFRPCPRHDLTGARR